MCVLRCPTTRAVLERNDCGTPLSMFLCVCERNVPPSCNGLPNVHHTKIFSYITRGLTLPT